MNDKQRQAQLDQHTNSGIHNMAPGICMHCGKTVIVGMENKCPHRQTNQQYAIYPLGTD